MKWKLPSVVLICQRFNKKRNSKNKDFFFFSLISAAIQRNVSVWKPNFHGSTVPHGVMYRLFEVNPLEKLCRPLAEKRKRSFTSSYSSNRIFRLPLEFISVQEITHTSQYGCQSNTLSLIHSGFCNVDGVARPCWNYDCSSMLVSIYTQLTSYHIITQLLNKM